ncbi:glycine cleavage system protein GcvH [Candidatus Bathyarchaeota archaeon]|nr:MAG: glycine cleavage system protein GcvH [Candidatus Bathyarchaeota archaeon]
MSTGKYLIPESLYYTEEHEWLRVEREYGVMGITDYAQKSLHEIVFVELPEVGTEVQQKGMLGTVESVKAVSDIFSPVSGVVIEVNEELIDKPEILNSDPYNAGWIAKIKPRNLNEELKRLMNAERYKQYLASLE